MRSDFDFNAGFPDRSAKTHGGWTFFLETTEGGDCVWLGGEYGVRLLRVVKVKRELCLTRFRWTERTKGAEDADPVVRVKNCVKVR